MCYVKMFIHQNYINEIFEILTYITIYRDIELLQQNFSQHFINQRTGSIVTSRITTNRHNDNFNTKLHPHTVFRKR